MLLKSDEETIFQGYDILDDRGRKIGSWFSLPGMDVMIKTYKKQDSIVITTPSQ